MSQRKLFYMLDGKKMTKIIPKDITLKKFDLTNYSFVNREIIDSYFAFITVKNMDDKDDKNLIKKITEDKVKLYDKLMLLADIMEDKNVLERIVIAVLENITFDKFIQMDSFDNKNITYIFMKISSPLFWQKLHMHDIAMSNLLVSTRVLMMFRYHNLITLMIDHNLCTKDVLVTAIISLKSITDIMDLYAQIIRIYYLDMKSLKKYISNLQSQSYYKKQILGQPSIEERYVTYNYSDTDDKEDLDLPKLIDWFYTKFWFLYKSFYLTSDFTYENVHKKILSFNKEAYVANALLEWIVGSSMILDQDLIVGQIILTEFPNLIFGELSLHKTIRIYVQLKRFDLVPLIFKKAKKIQLRYVEADLLIDNFDQYDNEFQNLLMTYYFDEYLIDKLKLRKNNNYRAQFAIKLTKTISPGRFYFSQILNNIEDQKCWIEINYMFAERLIDTNMWLKYVYHVLKKMALTSYVNIFYTDNGLAYPNVIIENWFLNIKIIDCDQYLYFYQNFYINQLFNFFPHPIKFNKLNNPFLHKDNKMVSSSDIPSNKEGTKLISSLGNKYRDVSPYFWAYVDKLLEKFPKIGSLIYTIIESYGSKYQFNEFKKRYPNIDNYNLFDIN